jgi:hypothetical protein
MAINLAQRFAGIQSPVDALQQGLTLGQEQSDRRALLEQQAAAQEQAKLMNQELLDFSRKGDRTADDYRDIIAKHPALADKFKASMEQLSADAKANTVTEATGIYAALRGGNVETATNILERKKQAAINSGDKQAESSADILLQTIKADPQSATAMAGLFLATATGDKFTDIEDQIQKQATAKIMDPVNLRQKLADVGKTEAETNKILAEAEKNKNAGWTDMSPQDIAEVGLPVGTVAQRGPEGQRKILYKPEGVAGEKPLTELGKLNADLESGAITREQFDAAATKKLGMSGETAFKAAAVEQAASIIPQVKALMFDESGALKRSNFIFTKDVPFASETKKMHTLFDTMLTAMLRGESGAVIGEDETADARALYMPQISESDESAELRFAQLIKRIELAEGNLFPDVGAGNKQDVNALLDKYAPEGQ